MEKHCVFPNMFQNILKQGSTPDYKAGTIYATKGLTFFSPFVTQRWLEDILSLYYSVLILLCCCITLLPYIVNNLCLQFHFYTTAFDFVIMCVARCPHPLLQQYYTLTTWGYYTTKSFMLMAQLHTEPSIWDNSHHCREDRGGYKLCDVCK